jgi:hypothetical protein
MTAIRFDAKYATRIHQRAIQNNVAGTTVTIVAAFFGSC